MHRELQGLELGSQWYLSEISTFWGIDLIWMLLYLSCRLYISAVTQKMPLEHIPEELREVFE